MRLPVPPARLLVALLVAVGASACVPPVIPGDPDPGGCARATSLPLPGDVGVDLRITGKVVRPEGQPETELGGLAIVKDRRSNVGAVLAEASVNDAGFFLLRARSSTVPADLDCRDYWIEVCAPASSGCVGAALFTDHDVTGLVGDAVGQGGQEVDISNEPLVYAIVE